MIFLQSDPDFSSCWIQTVIFIVTTRCERVDENNSINFSRDEDPDQVGSVDF